MSGRLRQVRGEAEFAERLCDALEVRRRLEARVGSRPTWEVLSPEARAVPWEGVGARCAHVAAMSEGDPTWPDLMSALGAAPAWSGCSAEDRALGAAAHDCYLGLDPLQQALVRCRLGLGLAAAGQLVSRVLH